MPNRAHRGSAAVNLPAPQPLPGSGGGSTHLQAGVGGQGLLAQQPLRLAVELLDHLACGTMARMLQLGR